MDTEPFDANQGAVRLSRALDLLLDCLLRAFSTNVPETADDGELPHATPDISSLEDGLSDGSSSNASKSDLLTRLPPPDFNS